MHISLIVVVVKTLESLSLRDSAESTGSHSLRLTSREDCAAVNAGKHTYLAPNRTDFGEASSVGTNAVVEYLRAHLLLLEIVKAVQNKLDLLGNVVKLVCEMSENVLVERVLSLLALVAVERLENIIHLLIRISAHSGVYILGDMLKLDIQLLLSYLGLYALDKRDDSLNLLVTKHNCAEHILFRNFLGARFNHHNGVLGSAEVKRKLGFCALLGIGVNNIIAVNHSDNNGAGGTCPRNIGY